MCRAPECPPPPPPPETSKKKANIGVRWLTCHTYFSPIVRGDNNVDNFLSRTQPCVYAQTSQAAQLLRVYAKGGGAHQTKSCVAILVESVTVSGRHNQVESVDISNAAIANQGCTRAP